MKNGNIRNKIKKKSFEKKLTLSFSFKNYEFRDKVFHNLPYFKKFGFTNMLSKWSTHFFR